MMATADGGLSSEGLTRIRNAVLAKAYSDGDLMARVAEATDTMREMLTAAMSVNLSLVAAEQGEVVKRLAGWAALLAVPTLVASWYGMNFDFMPETKARFGYPILVGGLVVAVGLLYRVLKKARWL
jgi:magnesium transporter